MNKDEYSYENAGFDGFLSRSIDQLSQVNLDSPGPSTNQIRYDASQTSGILGDKFKIGNILFDGKESRVVLTSDDNNDIITFDGKLKRIILSDGSNNRIYIGNLGTT